MSVMQLSFRQGPPPIALFWRGPQRGEYRAIPRDATGAIAAIIGPRGASGPAGNGAAHDQTFSAAASWTVNHNLGRRPAAVRVLSDGGIEVIAEIIEISTNQLIVQFAVPQSGRCVVL